MPYEIKGPSHLTCKQWTEYKIISSDNKGLRLFGIDFFKSDLRFGE